LVARAQGDGVALTEPTFADGTAALEAGRASDAIMAFESLADRGLVDPSASFDRGLAYALRVRLGAEQPGDLGRAAHGFEEARDLAADSATKEASSRALTIIRGEVARRRARSGEPVEVEQSPPPHVAVARSLAEDTWAGLAIAMSCAFAIALVVRVRTDLRRVKIGAAIAIALSVVVLAASSWATLIRRSERMSLEEAVVVTRSARPADGSGLALQGGTPLPEGARVQILEQNQGLVRIRWGSVNAWLPASTLRNLAKAP
jgi:hypothetical protein